MPDGKPQGAVVLLHGLTDTPYSLRHIAENYRQQGYVAIGIRLPGHGTVPAGLTDVDWQDWLAATRLAVREAKRLTGKDAPLHIVGFSNGGALAMKYSLDALDNAELAKPQRVILDFSDDRHYQLRAFFRPRGLARVSPRLLESRMVKHHARI